MNEQRPWQILHDKELSQWQIVDGSRVIATGIETEADALRLLAGNSPPGVVIVVEGGVFHEVLTNRDMDILIIDCDLEGLEEEELCAVSETDEDPWLAYVRFVGDETDPEYVDGRIAKFRVTEGKEC